MIDEFIYRHKWVILAVLVLLVFLGAGLIWWEKSVRSDKLKENQEMAELRAQNELLRQQLSQQAAQSVAGVTDKQENQSNKININLADTSELDSLPGIGPSKAADIIAYRQENGAFQTIEEIKKVKGIGDKTYENLKNQITVGD